MEIYICQECGEEFSKSQMDPDLLNDGYNYCKGCGDSLAQAGWDAVDPNHNYESYADWEDNEH